MRAQPMFPAAGLDRGMYESFYLRAVSPERPLGLWIRHTVHKRPGAFARGSAWVTVFDAARPAPLMAKRTGPLPLVPRDGWIEVAGEAAMGPGWARGSCGELQWSLRIHAREPELRHLRPSWLYRSPLPRTKLTSPAPLAAVGGTVRLPGGETLELRDWPGMVGHNWGTEHAARWIWVHGAGFAEDPGGWVDVALARVAVGRRLTPWLASGAISLDGRRRRLGRPGRPVRVRADATGCSVELAGESGLGVSLRASVPQGTAAGWRYADPRGGTGPGSAGEHDVVNCSIAGLELTVREGAGVSSLSSDHAGAYELGLPAGGAPPPGVAVAPFPDG